MRAARRQPESHQTPRRPTSRPGPARQLDLARELPNELKDPRARLEALRAVWQQTRREASSWRARLEKSRAAQRDLETSRDRYAHLYDSAPVGYISLNPTGRIVEVNLTATIMLGVRRGILLNQPLTIYVAKADIARFLEHLRRCRGSRSKVVSELRLRRADGVEMPVQLISSPLPTSLWRGSSLYLTVLTDLTERDQIADSLRQSKERLELALQAAHAGVWDLDLDTGMSTWSDEFSGLLGLNPKGTFASYGTLLGCIDPHDRGAAKQALRRIAKGRHANLHVEFRIHHPKKGVRWLGLLGRLDRDEHGRPTRLSGIGMDITERKQGEGMLHRVSQTLEQRVRDRTADLRAVNAELEHQIAVRRQLERQVLEISEREQRRIGRDLHDGLGQQLTGTRFLTSVLQEKLLQKSLPEAAEVAHLAQLLDQAKCQIRQLARGLHPVAPEPNGLMSALEQLSDGVAQIHGISCRFNCPRPVFIADTDVATHLFRIAQEAVNNAIHHGRARRLSVDLTANNGAIRLEIQNDGARWRPGGRNQQGLGLKIMRYRSEAIGANLEVRQVRPRGALVCCCVPLAVATTPGADHEDR